MNKLSPTLKDLIYKYNNTIIVESKDLDTIFKEIETVRTGSKLSGYIFRPGFAETTTFKDYTPEDYIAIYAQWSLSFGWSSLFESISGKNPQNLLDNYLKETGISSLSPLITEEKTPIVKEYSYLKELAINFMESKIVLTSHQKEILINMPDYLLRDVYNTSNITIKENRILVVQSLLKTDPDFNPFRNVSDVIPILISLYSSYDGVINKSTLKNIEIKIPTKMKRKVIEVLLKNNINALENFKSYQDFWKKLLRQLVIKNFDRTVRLYPEFKKIHTLIHSNIKTTNSLIEQYKKDGLLEEAFIEEMKNPGYFARHILFYLRNQKGLVYPTKGKANQKTSVKTDISKIIYSEKFASFLDSVNPKLLVQIKGLLSDEKYYKLQFVKRMNGVNIKYSNAILGLNKQWSLKVLSLIEDSYKKIKRKSNLSLGKVFIDDDLKDIKVSFSGRIDTAINTSGVYLPIGSKIKIDKIFEEDSLIRFGVSWKSPESDPSLSICIDQSINILNGRFEDDVVNWQSATLKEKKTTYCSSSGDITVCSLDKWSTEIVDIDVDAMKKVESTRFFTTVINYNAPKGDLGSVDTYIFFNVINREDRIIQGRHIEIPLDKMDYSYKIDDFIQAQIGLLFDLEEGTVEVLKIPLKNVFPSSSATNLNKEFKELIDNRPKLLSVYDSLIDAIDESQITKDKLLAENVFDIKTDNSLINKVLF